MLPGAGPADRSLSPREDDFDVTVRERDRVRPFLVLHGGRRPRRVTRRAARLEPELQRASGMKQCRQSYVTGSVAQGLVGPEAQPAFLVPSLPRAPHEKGGITAGQRGGLDKVGSRSLPKPGNGRHEQPKFVTKYSCYLQLYGRGGRI